MAGTDEVIVSKLDNARKELLDLGLRNPLLNYRLLKSRGLEIVDELPEEVFRILVKGSRKMSFLAVNQDEDADLMGQPDEEINDGPAGRHTDSKLQTGVSSDELQNRLLKTYYWANSYIQDHGANILFVALGMLKWYEADSSDIARYAPLVLIPVELERANVRDRFHLSYTEEDIGGNLSLMEKLRTEFGISLPNLPEDEEELDLETYFGSLRESVGDFPRWEVNANSIVLGFFSFSKFLMYRDLDVSTWPEDTQPTGYEVIRSLLDTGFHEPQPSLGIDDHLDDHLSAQEVHHVVDADSSQMLAIHDALEGRNLVIQGPPGTGKSQTITNIIAEAIGQDKTVLFVSEKMAALDVVKRRLDSVGLGDACLELHSHKTTKRAVLAELERTLQLGKPRTGQIEDDFEELNRLRHRLNAYSEAVNTPVAGTGVTPIQAYGELYSLQRNTPESDLPKLDMPEIASWNRSQFRERQAIVDELQTRVAAMGVPAQHPFWGTNLKVILPTDRQALRSYIGAAQESLDTLMQTSNLLISLLGISETRDLLALNVVLNGARYILESPDLSGFQIRSNIWLEKASDIGALISSGTAYMKIHQQYEGKVIPDAWDQEMLATRQILSTKGSSAFRLFSGEYRRAKNDLKGLCTAGLPSGVNAQIQLLDAIMESQRHKAVLNQEKDLAEGIFGSLWRGLDSDWTFLNEAATYLISVYEGVNAGAIPTEIIGLLDCGPSPDELQALITQLGGVISHHIQNCSALQTALALDTSKRFGNGYDLADQPFMSQSNALRDWIEGLDDIHQMTSFNTAAGVCLREGLEPIVILAETWEDGGELLSDALKQAWYEKILQQAFGEREALGSFDGPSHHQQVLKFQDMDRLVFEHNQARLALRHWEELPKHQEAGGQLGVLQREFQKKRRHLPIQRLMEQAGNAVQAIKPVLMMSPLSIASYLPPGGLKFDMVVFDEASQVKPVDSFGAILRGKQAVVVGDNQQLPPTNFFDTMNLADDDDDDSPTSDIESILGLFLAQNAPDTMLRWHYRSLHESLIMVSNKEFYQNNLVVFPSPDSGKEELGLIFHHIPEAIYDRGSSRTNRRESEEVADAVMEHAKMRPHLSLGVAAFSTAQMTAIQDRVEYLRRHDPSYESFFVAHPHEPFFVKNLENVQGDERDVIFISVGYGRDSSGRITMDFGPLSRDGGHRRLNVLITRAKRRCEIFSGITSDDIDAGRSRYRGVPALKTYLAYAENGVIDLPQETDREVDSPFQNAVAQELKTLGYDVRQEVGTAGKFIDIAIVDPEKPGRFLIGIECDGATYHSSRSARDRDRIREQVLKDRGWQIHRIWSTDWFKNSQRELNKTVEAIESAKVYKPVAEEIVEANSPAVVRDGEVNSPSIGQGTPRYETANLNISTGNNELYTISRDTLGLWISEVVETESPVHISDVARRVANAVGVRRVASRIQQAIDEGARNAVRKGRIRAQGGFLWKPTMDEPNVRDRSQLSAASRKIELIAPEELAGAVHIVVTSSYGIDRGDIPQRVSRILGFKQSSENMRAIIEDVITEMILDGRIRDDGTGHLSVI